MANCPECPEEGLPEWIMSYADMITILMAFFVVMYSMAGKTDEKKAEAVVRSLRIWLGGFRGPGPDMHSQRTTTAPERGSSQPTNSVKTFQSRESTAAGGTMYYKVDQQQLDDEDRLQLDMAVEVLAGKRHLVEIRAQASRRPLPPDSGFEDHYALAYHVAKLAADYLVARGIEQERIQLRVAARPGPGTAASDRMLLSHDCRVDVFLLNEVLPVDLPEGSPSAAAESENSPDHS
ncbi:MAG: hypothetical protein K1X74_09370 [Pirellulales bacterium]|nr:hypothetical protein [Pirellulales bacterium]